MKNLKRHEKDDENLISGHETTNNSSLVTSSSRTQTTGELRTPFPRVKEQPGQEDDADDANKLRAKTGIPMKNALKNVNMTVNPLYEMQDLSNVMNLWEMYVEKKIYIFII